MDSKCIEISPDVCNGKPVVRGTRITVDTVLGHLSAGDSISEVLSGYPSLTESDVLACIDYARRVGSARSLAAATT